MPGLRSQQLLFGTLIPAIFSSIVLITIPNPNDYIWMNLGFIWFFYLLSSLLLYINYSSKRHAVLNWTMDMCIVIGFIVEILVSLTLIYVRIIGIQWAISIHLVLLLCFLIITVITIYSNQKTKKDISRQDNNNNLVNDWKLKVDILQKSISAPELKQLSDLLSASPINSSSAVDEIEEEISSKIKELPDSCMEIMHLIRRRNLILKNIN